MRFPAIRFLSLLGLFSWLSGEFPFKVKLLAGDLRTAQFILTENPLK